MIGDHFKCMEQRCELMARASALIAVFAAGCVSGPLTADPAHAAPPISTDHSPATSYSIERGPVDPGLPTPESIIGHAIGDGAVRYEPMVRYLRALADASPRVMLTPYAESHEGRTLFYLTVTSEANHARLAAIKADNAKLADPRTLSGEDEAERILDTLPGVAWMAYTIHGDELSSTDAAIEVAYQLAAGTDDCHRRLREELVIHIDPLMNPDGRERYLGQLQHLTGRVPNPDYQAMQHWGLWSAGRGNHYLFDLNRDWLMQVHPETRGRAAQILAWNPHLLVDSHEMGPTDTYLFDPPREPYNVNLSESNMNWRRRFSADHASAFDRYGWSYYTGDWHEEWYPGYTNAWASLLGAIGLLYEQAGVNAASVRQPAGTTLTYPEAVHHQMVASLANLETLRANRRDILEDFLADRRWAVSGERSGTELFLVPPPANRPLLNRLIDLLGRQGIESNVAASPFQAHDVVDIWGQKLDTRSFPAGTLVVQAAQPHRRLLRALLEFDPHMSDRFLHDERKELENHRGTRVYDVTAWNLSMAYGLETFWAGSAPEPLVLQNPTYTPTQREGKPGYGYLIDGASSDIHAAIARLLTHECKLRVATERFAIAGYEYRPGTVLLRNHENPDELARLIEELTAGLDLEVQPVHTALSESGPDLGSQRFRLLAEPRIAIASQWPVSPTSFGSIWHLLDARIGLRVSPVKLQAIGMVDLRKYNVIVLPHTWGVRGLTGILNEQVRAKIRSWLEAGGTLIAMGGSAAFTAGKDRGLTSVRLRRDALDELGIYEEALEREKNARRIRIDPAIIWNGGKPDPDHDKADTSEDKDKTNAKPSAGTDLAKLKRKDAWQQLFRPGGAIAAATLNPEHWLCFGVGDGATDDPKLPVLISGRYAFLSRHPVATPVRLADEADLRLSGLLWPEARERLANTAYATVERVGYGQVILFATDPFLRGYFEGSGRLLLNALLLGPGMGTSQSVPW